MQHVERSVAFWNVYICRVVEFLKHMNHYNNYINISILIVGYWWKCAAWLILTYPFLLPALCFIIISWLCWSSINFSILYTLYTFSIRCCPRRVPKCFSERLIKINVLKYGRIYYAIKFPKNEWITSSHTHNYMFKFKINHTPL